MHKIFKIIAAVLSLFGIISLVRIISAGDEAMETGEKAGLFEPMAYTAYVILGLVVLFVLIFVIQNLFTNTSSLKSTLIGVGAFAAVLIIAYVISGGDPMAYKSGDEMATESQSHLVGAGLIAFYILLAVAAISMIFSGVKKVISK
jgi:protein-S-isoprenylcysteine O-methyltransferase Ste14